MAGNEDKAPDNQTQDLINLLPEGLKADSEAIKKLSDTERANLRSAVENSEKKPLFEALAKRRSQFSIVPTIGNDAQYLTAFIQNNQSTKTLESWDKFHGILQTLPGAVPNAKTDHLEFKAFITKNSDSLSRLFTAICNGNANLSEKYATELTVKIQKITEQQKLQQDLENTRKNLIKVDKSWDAQRSKFIEDHQSKHHAQLKDLGWRVAHREGTYDIKDGNVKGEDGKWVSLPDSTEIFLTNEEFTDLQEAYRKFEEQEADSVYHETQKIIKPGDKDDVRRGGKAPRITTETVVVTHRETIDYLGQSLYGQKLDKYFYEKTLPEKHTNFLEKQSFTDLNGGHNDLLTEEKYLHRLEWENANKSFNQFFTGLKSGIAEAYASQPNHDPAILKDLTESPDTETFYLNCQKAGLDLAEARAILDTFNLELQLKTIEFQGLRFSTADPTSTLLYKNYLNKIKESNPPAQDSNPIITSLSESLKARTNIIETLEELMDTEQSWFNNLSGDIDTITDPAQKELTATRVLNLLKLQGQHQKLTEDILANAGNLQNYQDLNYPGSPPVTVDALQQLPSGEHEYGPADPKIFRDQKTLISTKNKATEQKILKYLKIDPTKTEPDSTKPPETVDLKYETDPTKIYLREFHHGTLSTVEGCFDQFAYHQSQLATIPQKFADFASLKAKDPTYAKLATHGSYEYKIFHDSLRIFDDTLASLQQSQDTISSTKTDLQDQLAQLEKGTLKDSAGNPIPEYLKDTVKKSLEAGINQMDTLLTAEDSPFSDIYISNLRTERERLYSEREDYDAEKTWQICQMTVITLAAVAGAMCGGWLAGGIARGIGLGLEGAGWASRAGAFVIHSVGSAAGATVGQYGVMGLSDWAGVSNYAESGAFEGKEILKSFGLNLGLSVVSRFGGQAISYTRSGARFAEGVSAYTSPLSTFPKLATGVMGRLGVEYAQELIEEGSSKATEELLVQAGVSRKTANGIGMAAELLIASINAADGININANLNKLKTSSAQYNFTVEGINLVYTTKTPEEFRESLANTLVNEKKLSPEDFELTIEKNGMVLLSFDKKKGNSDEENLLIFSPSEQIHNTASLLRLFPNCDYTNDGRIVLTSTEDLNKLSEDHNFLITRDSNNQVTKLKKGDLEFSILDHTGLNSVDSIAKDLISSLSKIAPLQDINTANEAAHLQTIKQEFQRLNTVFTKFNAQFYKNLTPDLQKTWNNIENSLSESLKHLNSQSTLTLEDVESALEYLNNLSIKIKESKISDFLKQSVIPSYTPAPSTPPQTTTLGLPEGVVLKDTAIKALNTLQQAAQSTGEALTSPAPTPTEPPLASPVTMPSSTPEATTDQSISESEFQNKITQISGIKVVDQGTENERLQLTELKAIESLIQSPDLQVKFLEKSGILTIKNTQNSVSIIINQSILDELKKPENANLLTILKEKSSTPSIIPSSTEPVITPTATTAQSLPAEPPASTPTPEIQQEITTSADIKEITLQPFATVDDLIYLSSHPQSATLPENPSALNISSQAVGSPEMTVAIKSEQENYILKNEDLKKVLDQHRAKLSITTDGYKILGREIAQEKINFKDPNDPNIGWKIHLNVAPENVAAVADYLIEEGYFHKYLQGGEVEDGKIFTVYIGSQDLTASLAKEISQDIGSYLAKPLAHDEIEFAPGIVGRFVGPTNEFRQYGYHGMSSLNNDPDAIAVVFNPLSPSEKESLQKNIATRSFDALKTKYGDYFTGTLSQSVTPPVSPTESNASPASTPAPAPTATPTESTPTPELQKEINTVTDIVENDTIARAEITNLETLRYLSKKPNLKFEFQEANGNYLIKVKNTDKRGMTYTIPVNRAIAEAYINESKAAQSSTPTPASPAASPTPTTPESLSPDTPSLSIPTESTPGSTETVSPTLPIASGLQTAPVEVNTPESLSPDTPSLVIPTESTPVSTETISPTLPTTSGLETSPARVNSAPQEIPANTSTEIPIISPQSLIINLDHNISGLPKGLKIQLNDKGEFIVKNPTTNAVLINGREKRDGYNLLTAINGNLISIKRQKTGSTPEQDLQIRLLPDGKVTIVQKGFTKVTSLIQSATTNSEVSQSVPKSAPELVTYNNLPNFGEFDPQTGETLISEKDFKKFKDQLQELLAQGKITIDQNPSATRLIKSFRVQQDQKPDLGPAMQGNNPYYFDLNLIITTDENGKEAMALVPDIHHGGEHYAFELNLAKKFLADLKVAPTPQPLVTPPAPTLTTVLPSAEPLTSSTLATAPPIVPPPEQLTVTGSAEIQPTIEINMPASAPENQQQLSLDRFRSSLSDVTKALENFRTKMDTKLTDPQKKSLDDMIANSKNLEQLANSISTNPDPEFRKNLGSFIDNSLQFMKNFNNYQFSKFRDSKLIDASITKTINDLNQLLKSYKYTPLDVHYPEPPNDITPSFTPDEKLTDLEATNQARQNIKNPEEKDNALPPDMVEGYDKPTPTTPELKDKSLDSAEIARRNRQFNLGEYSINEKANIKANEKFNLLGSVDNSTFNSAINAKRNETWYKDKVESAKKFLALYNANPSKIKLEGFNAISDAQIKKFVDKIANLSPLTDQAFQKAVKELVSAGVSKKLIFNEGLNLLLAFQRATQIIPDDKLDESTTITLKKGTTKDTQADRIARVN